MNEMSWPELAAAFTIAGVVTTILNLVLSRAYGMGMSKVASEQRIDKIISDRVGKVDEALLVLRNDVYTKHDSSIGNIGTAITHMKDLITGIQLDHAEHRAKATELYMRRDSYHLAMSELRKEMAEQFGRMDKRLDQLTDVVMDNGGRNSG